MLLKDQAFNTERASSGFSSRFYRATVPAATKLSCLPKGKSHRSDWDGEEMGEQTRIRSKRLPDTFTGSIKCNN